MVPVRSPSSSYSIGGPDAVNRITQLYGTDNDAGVQRKTLTPEEVVEVARALASPVAVPEGGFKRAELKRRRSAGATHRRTQQDPVSPETPPVALEPVEYVQLDEDTLLPFVDRPEEVAELLNHPSNEKMFKSLRAAFPKTPARADWQTLRPEEWNWEEFCWHLTQPSRVECSDYTWVFRARQAVRQRSVALWEKVGVCIGCDGDLLNAGGEDGIPLSWGGLGLGEEGEYDPSANQVYIAALEAVDPAETEKAERDFREEFGDIVEDEGEAAAMRMAALAEKDTMKETEEEARSSGRSTSLRPTKRDSQAQYGELAGNPNQNRPSRSKSFVGLQILTSHSLKPYSSTLRRSPSATQTPRLGASLPIFERGPGSPLFPSSFTSLSVEPNLGRSASVGLAGGFSGGFGVSSMEYGVGGRDKDWAEVSRKPSGAPISESEWLWAPRGHPVADELMCLIINRCNHIRYE